MSKEQPTIGFIAAMAVGDEAHLIVPSDPSIKPFTIRLTQRIPPKSGRASTAYRFTDESGMASITCFADGHLTYAPSGLDGHIAILNCVDYKHIRVVKPAGSTRFVDGHLTAAIPGNYMVTSIPRNDPDDIVPDRCPGDNTCTDPGCPHHYAAERLSTGDVEPSPITREQDEIRKLQETIQAMNIERENLLATIRANDAEMRDMRGELLDAHEIALHVEPGYEQLADILRGALQQAQAGKGAERHADNKPFHEQPIIAINEILGSVDGLIYQVIKKAKESRGLPTLEAKLRETYGVINYAAAMAIMYRKAADADAPVGVC